MALTRAQLLMGNSGQGTPVLPNQVQGVRQGSGVEILADGTINFKADTAAGVVRTNNPSAFNSYVWPDAALTDGQLVLRSGNTLGWGRVPGFGLLEQGTNAESLKAALPISNTAPVIGSELEQAPEGGLYWNSESGLLFINYGGAWTQASYGPTDLQEELLTGTYTLYVNPEIGSDEYIEGNYNPTATPIVTNQMVTAGYTPQKPFKTIQRAALEVARLQLAPGLEHLAYDRFVIKCSAGLHLIDNTPASGSVSAWVSGTVPTGAQLRSMNSTTYAGVILPRGVSVIGEDLRKTVIRPTYVPPRSGDIDTSRGAIFRITGGSFFFNFTFKDKLDLLESHHLLECFSFVSDSDLTTYYSKVQTIFGQLSPDAVVNPGETEIVAPQPPGSPEESTDGVFGSSPYIFNCSVRSLYGLCGINADGSAVTGFKSMVTSQFTGVSLQKDLYCWQKYNVGPKTWTNTISNYNSYIALDPNNVRMDPARRSFHIRAVNNAFIQEVSVFAIGQGIHHWVKSGGEVSINDSNSSFGGCAALAEGYKEEAFPQDTNWNVAAINIATNLADQPTLVNQISIGTVDAITVDNSTTITLVQPLVDSDVNPGVPNILASRNYTFKEGSYLWIENPGGKDWRAPLTAAAWTSTSPSQVDITVPMENQDGDSPGVAGAASLAGSKVYIRRLVDNRTLGQRRYSINVTNTDANTRTPLRDYVLQTTIGSGGGIVDLLPDTDMVIINKSGPIPIGSDPVSKKAQIVLERANPLNEWTGGNYYRPGDTVRYQNKHFTCVVTNSDSTFEADKWSQSYVHMPSDYNAYDFFINVAPIIYFDNDTDGAQPTENCGYNLGTCWTTDTSIISQYTTATDYRGVYQFLIGIGFTAPQVTNLLTPTMAADRELNPSSSIDMDGYVPSGAANQLANWPVEFRRPSILRMFGHAWEWSGFLNYTKALPAYQGDLSPQNQFTYYFTNQLGGRVYATGYNQEGFYVTPAGLTDLSSGTTIGVANIGNPFAGIDLPTYYPNLTVDSLVVNNSATFSGDFVSNGPIVAPNVYTPGRGLVIAGTNINTTFVHPDTLTDLVYSTNTTLTEPTYYCTNLTVDAGVTVTTAYQTTVFFCTGSVTINGTINADGKGSLGGTTSISRSDTTAGSFDVAGLNMGTGAGGGSYSSTGLGGEAGYSLTPVGGGPVSPFLSLTGSGGAGGFGVAATVVTGYNSNIYTPYGGAGGGGVVIRSLGTVTIGATGTITANGNIPPPSNVFAGSSTGTYLASAGGGGSGGTIILHSDAGITNDGILSAKGGDGRAGMTTDAGYFLGSDGQLLGSTGGGGGYIITQTPGTLVSGTMNVSGGAVGPSLITGTGVNLIASGQGGTNAGLAGYFTRNPSTGVWFLIPAQAGKTLTYGSPFE